MSRPEYDETERIVHSIFDEMGIDAFFSDHVWDSVGDTGRSGRDKSVKPEEIIKAFTKFKYRYGPQMQRFMQSERNFTGVLKDVAAQLNIPLAFEQIGRGPRAKYLYRLEAITLMRKPTHRFRSVRPTDVELKV